MCKLLYYKGASVGYYKGAACVIQDATFHVALLVESRDIEIEIMLCWITCTLNMYYVLSCVFKERYCITVCITACNCAMGICLITQCTKLKQLSRNVL